MLRFHAVLSQAATRVEDALEMLLPSTEVDVAKAMRYGTLNGGKRLRAFLLIETAGLFNAPPSQADRAAAAVECIHAYSLIHDDLPAMDNDDTRRGKPTVHKKWDEATAILAGDALQTLAFEILSAPQTAPDPNVRLKLITRLAQASGAAGMVGGQALDIAAEHASSPLTLDQITTLQDLKTGALISYAVEAGAILGKSNAANLHVYARNLGLAFQISDDILDVEGDPKAAGKELRKDASAGKATFVSLLGVEGAKAKAKTLIDEACEVLKPYGSTAENLRMAAIYSIERKA